MHLEIESFEKIITHNLVPQDLSTVVKELKTRIMDVGDKPDATVNEQLKLLDELAEFGFGQCLIRNKGITGLWTRYMVLYPKWRYEFPEEEKALSELNRWLLEKSPLLLATQERFIHFQTLLQEHIQNGMCVASIPCGLMDDLLTLDLSKLSDVRLIGIDLDNDSLERARETAKHQHLEKQSSFIKSDAWQLNMTHEFDIITSNGLNFYEFSGERVVELYRNFYTALKPNGILITSFLTPPPILSRESPWDMKNINLEDLRIQKVIMSYILNAKFQAFRTEEQTLQQLREVGFRDMRMIYDKAKLFPTILAIK